MTDADTKCAICQGLYPARAGASGLCDTCWDRRHTFILALAHGGGVAEASNAGQEAQHMIAVATALTERELRRVIRLNDGSLGIAKPDGTPERQA